MQDIVYIPYYFNADNSYSLFTNQAIFNMRYINKYIKELRKD